MNAVRNRSSQALAKLGEPTGLVLLALFRVTAASSDAPVGPSGCGPGAGDVDVLLALWAASGGRPGMWPPGPEASGRVLQLYEEHAEAVALSADPSAVEVWERETMPALQAASEAVRELEAEAGQPRPQGGGGGRSSWDGDGDAALESRWRAFLCAEQQLSA